MRPDLTEEEIKALNKRWGFYYDDLSGRLSLPYPASPETPEDTIPMEEEIEE